MKLNKIMFFFILAFPVSVLLRTLQLLFTVDYVTGFYHNGKETIGTVLLIMILLSSLFMGIFARLTFSRPDNPPKSNIITAICSVALCVGIFGEIFIQSLPSSVLPWQAFLLQAMSILTAIYFLCYALTFIVDFNIPKILSVLPVIYLIIKIVCDFTVISKLAIISDNILTIAAYCLNLLFFLQLAKFYNGIDSDICFKKLLSFGLPAVILSVTSSVPNIIVNIISNGSYFHTSLGANISLLFFGTFILSYLISYFYKKSN